MTLSPENMVAAVRELLDVEIDRRERAEQEIERLRGCLRGIVYKSGHSDMGSVQAAADRCLQKSLAYYPHPIKGAPKDPGDVKR